MIKSPCNNHYKHKYKIKKIKLLCILENSIAYGLIMLQNILKMFAYKHWWTYILYLMKINCT